MPGLPLAFSPLPRGDGDGGGMMKLENILEYALEDLRYYLRSKPDELRHYEKLYKAFKSSSSDEARRAAAFEILKRHLSEAGLIGLIKGEER
jgi:hypothetical protein